MPRFLYLLFLLPCGPALTAQSYDYAAPRLIAALDKELDEISGLSLAANQEELLAVQDETGKVYRLNARSGQLLWAVAFWKDGDYEGVEVVGEDIWVVKNTGTLYRITRPGAPDQHVEKYNGALTAENDVEGLTYDRKHNRLLLACKSDADDDGNDKDGRYIYAFDLATATLSERPVFAITREAVTNFLEQHPGVIKHEKLCDFFIQRDDYDLAPSAIAIHPTTGDLYLTSSVGKVLMVLTPGGQIKELHKLDKDYFPQPEGLAFAPNGDLFISTEAKKDRPARLYRLDNLSK